MNFDEAKNLLTPKRPLIFDLEEVEQTFNIRFSATEREGLRVVPFSREILTASLGTHILFPSLPISMSWLLQIHPKCFYPFPSPEYKWEGGPAWAMVPLPVRWHLMRLNPLDRSRRKTWEQQKAMLAPEDEVAHAGDMAFASALCQLSRKEFIFTSFFRTADFALTPNDDDVQCDARLTFTSDAPTPRNSFCGMTIRPFPDIGCTLGLGLATERKI